MTRAARDERRQNRGPAARRRRPQTRSVSVGVMALMGALVLTGILFGLGDSELLSARTFDVYAEFGRINGIGRGSAVHVAGAAAGEVTDIRFPRSPAEKFRLTLRVRERFHGLVRTDSVVSLQTGGVVGGKLVQIEPGDDAALQAPAGSTLATAEDKHAADPLARARSVLVSVDTALDTARAKLAREAEICYTTIALVTDFDCWHPEHDQVTVEMIVANLTRNARTAQQVIAGAVAQLPIERTCPCASALRHAIITRPEAIPESARQELRPLVGKYLS